MATNPYRNKFDEEDDLSYLKQGKTKIEWPLSDGSVIDLWVHEDILTERNTSGSDYLYPREQRLEYVHEEIKKQFQQMKQELEKVVEATITTASEISDESLSTIKKALETKLQQSVTIEVMMDEGLIGGAKIQIGDNMIDASIRSQINELGRILTN